MVTIVTNLLSSLFHSCTARKLAVWKIIKVSSHHPHPPTLHQHHHRNHPCSAPSQDLVHQPRLFWNLSSPPSLTLTNIETQLWFQASSHLPTPPHTLYSFQSMAPRHLLSLSHSLHIAFTLPVSLCYITLFDKHGCIYLLFGGNKRVDLPPFLLLE
jgi:hypothetical protein